MSLRLVYGRGGCGKSTWCINEISMAAKNGSSRPLIFIVPEQFSFQAGKNLLENAGESIMSKVSVLSFSRMAYKVFMETGGLGRKYMNPAGKAMLIYSIMEENKDNFKIFARAARQKSFTQTVSDMITEFKRYSVSPETLIDAAQNEDKNLDLKNKLSDLYIIYSDFEKQLHEKYINSDDDLTALSEKLEYCNIFDGAEVWIDEFSSFTTQEYLVFEKLLKKAFRINVTLPVEGDSSDSDYNDCDVFAPIRNTEMKLLKIASDNNTKLEKPVLLDSTICKRFKNSFELNHIEKNYFSYPFKIFKGKCNDINIFKAANRFSEIEHIAREITTLCRDSKLRYRDIAVITRNIDIYEGSIKAVFGEYKIPYFLDKKRSIENSPVVVLMLSAIDIISKGFSYESVFRYLKTGLTGINQHDIDLIENYVLAAGIRGKKWTEEKQWDYRLNFDYNAPQISEEDKIFLKYINDLRTQITKPLIKLQSDIKGKKSAIIISEAIYRFLLDIKVNETIEEKIAILRDNGEFDTAGEYSKVWDIVMEVLSQSVEVLKDTSVSLDKYINIISAGLKQEEIGIIPPSLDQVIVGSADRIRNHGVKVLFVIGVNDGIFPAVVNSEGILSDRDRESLKDIGIELAKDSRSTVFEEQYLIYKTITMPSSALNLSYSIADHEGRTLRPSVIISRVKKIFPNIKEKSNLIIDGNDREIMDMISRPTATFRDMVGSMRKYVEKTNVNIIWKDVYRWYINNKEWEDKYNTAVNNLSYTNLVDEISQKSVRKLYGKQLRTSISRLERYSECPFAYFVEYGLKAKERKIYELNPPEIGSLVHKVLDEFSQIVEDEKKSWRELDFKWVGSTISEITDKILEENPTILKSSPRYVYISEKLKKLIIRAVNVMIYHIKKGTFNPIEHEMSFSNGGEFPPIKIKLNSGEDAELSGRIDRIDKAENEDGAYLRIIDYKTGNKDFKISDIYNGIEMQLLVYMDAILEHAEKTGENLIPGGVLYFRVDDPIIKTNTKLDDEKIENEIMKKLKMKGLVLSDINVIKSMDKEFDKSSIVIPVTFKTDGTLTDKSSAVSPENFNLLRTHVKKKIIEFCEDMLKGVIEIRPCKNRNKTACEFCSFLPICKFDTSMQDNKYKLFKDMTNKEAMDKIAYENSKGESKNE